jgi:hypothetical protein
VSAPSQKTHDWEIGVSKFRLAPKEITAQQAHRVEPVPFLSQQISSTAELSYSDIDRRREVAFAQNNFSGGVAADLDFKLERQNQFRYAKNADTSTPGGKLLPGPKINTIGSAIADKPTVQPVERNSVTYIGCGTKLYQVASSSSTPVLDTTFAASITALYIWGGVLIVGLGDANNFEYRASDTSAGAFTGGGVPGRYFTSINDTIYRAVRPDQLSNAQAITGPWADYDVGDSSYNITSLTAFEQVIVVGKEDGPYGFDQNVVAQPLTPEMKLQADTQICKVATVFNRDYFFTTRRGQARFRPGEGFRSVGLDLLADPALPANDSRPYAATSDGRFLYVIVAPSGTTGVYIWKRDFADAWHNYLWRSDLGQAAEMVYATGKIGSTSVNAIVFAYQSGVNWQLAYARWPATLDPTKDTAYTFETTVPSVLRTLDYTASYPTIKKYSDRLKHVVDSATSDRATTYVAYLDDETDAVTLGEYKKSPYEEKVLGNPLEYHRVSLETSTTSEASSPPKIRAFHLSASYLARVVNRHTCNFLGVKNTPLLTGGRQRNEWDDDVNKLQELQRSRAQVECTDENLRTFNAYVDDVTVWTAQDRQAAGFDPVQVATCVITEIGESEA